MNNQDIIPVYNLIRAARNLKSDNGENPEYDRALVELITEALGGTSDDCAAVAEYVGITNINW